MENTQPISNRREKEQYPKYIKYIPTDKVNTLPAEEDEITA
ncbi:hypothetical protein [Dorea sp. D27]|nr:hypothetical protein [Dorea sp. D27]